MPLSRLFELDRLDIMEVAAISGHKSLSQLQRYTHLKAHKLVKKLDGNNSRTKQAILSRLVPYPALVEKTGERYVVRFLDFNDLAVYADTEESAFMAASHVLLNRIVSTIIGRFDAMPNPDQFTEMLDREKVVFIEPLLPD